MPQAFERLIVEVDVRQLDFALGQRVGIDSKVMVVRRDLDLPRLQLLYRMIAAVVPKLQLEGLAPEGNSRQLMPQADAENRLPPHQPADRIDRIRARLRVAWTVREKNSV